MVEFLKTLAIACIPAIITGIVTYIVARKNAASQISIIKEQNKHDLEKLMEQHKVDIEHLKEAHRLDMKAKVYLEKQDGSNHTSDEFESAIRQAANGLRQQGRIDNSQHSAICKDIDNLRKIFNGYMHNTEGYPSSEALKNFFKCHRKFIQECLR